MWSPRDLCRAEVDHILLSQSPTRVLAYFVKMELDRV
jgi:hypothetical protein